MQELELLKELFDNKLVNVINVLINDRSEGLYLNEVSRAANVSPATTYRIINKLVNLEIIQEIRVKKLKIYKFTKSEDTEFLYKLFKKDIQVLKVFIEQVKNLEGLNEIILHGQEERDRANVLLIGSNIDPGKLKEVCGDIKEKHNFIISPLILTEEQYDSMSKMGLYSGKKNIIFKR